MLSSHHRPLSQLAAQRVSREAEGNACGTINLTLPMSCPLVSYRDKWQPYQHGLIRGVRCEFVLSAPDGQLVPVTIMLSFDDRGHLSKQFQYMPRRIGDKKIWLDCQLRNDIYWQAVTVVSGK